MRLHIGRASSGDEPSGLRSVVSAPSSLASSATCVLLLATLGDAPVGSLRLREEAPFCVHTTSLRLPAAADGAEVPRDEIASQLLWHAARELPALRSGGALLAQPASDDDGDTLQSFGFAPTSTAADAPLALVRRRDPAEVPGYSHHALRVSDIEVCLDFWSLLHFTPSRLFTTSGARAAWLSAPWTDLTIELIEIPEVVLKQIPPAQRAPSEVALGPAHLVVDVTALGVALPGTLDALQQRSSAAFGRTLRLLTKPHQQMIGGLVTEACVVGAPDGVQLRLTHQQGFVQRDMEADWKRKSSSPAAPRKEAPPPAPPAPPAAASSGA